MNLIVIFAANYEDKRSWVREIPGPNVPHSTEKVYNSMNL